MRTPAGDVWISVSQFRTHMHRVLREVESGQTFTITRSGRAVARLVGLAPEVIEDSDLECPRRMVQWVAWKRPRCT